MAHPRAAYPPCKITLWVGEDDWEWLKARSGPLGASRIVRDLIIEHRRKICDRKDGRICIRDRVTGAGRHRLEWFFHFAHDLDAVPLDATTVSLRGAMSGREYLRLGAESDSPLKLRLIRGRRDPLCGWVSLNSAQVIPAWVAVFEAEVEVPCLAEFELQIMP